MDLKSLSFSPEEKAYLKNLERQPTNNPGFQLNNSGMQQPTNPGVTDPTVIYNPDTQPQQTSGMPYWYDPENAFHDDMLRFGEKSEIPLTKESTRVSLRDFK